ncbi:MAG: hypothetical protein ACWA5A_10380 [Marinibacterium sp.]
MRKLYLHIGHPKTGSSFLQACFANSIDSLAGHGIDYPKARANVTRAAENWQISSGNGSLLLNKPADEVEITQDAALFSSEGLFTQFMKGGDAANRILKFCQHHDVPAVDILMFTRDPIPHAESSYQQGVKRSGQKHSADLVFQKFNKPLHVLQVRKTLENHFPGVKVNWHVYNYERHKRELVGVCERFLGIPEGTLSDGGNRPVNRSLSAGELELVRALNRMNPDAGAALADALCDKAPDVASEKVYPSHDVQQAMIDRLAPDLDELNTYLAPEEHYSRELQPPAEDRESYGFTGQQLKVIAQTLGDSNLWAALAEAEALGDAAPVGAARRKKRRTQGA